jgi:hypothetical protein
MGFLCRLIVNTGYAGITTMAMHAESNAQALIAAQELFPACDVRVVCNVQARRRHGAHQARPQSGASANGGSIGKPPSRLPSQDNHHLSS